MALTKDEIIEVLTKAKELGLTHIKLEGLECDFRTNIGQITSPQTISHFVPEMKSEEIVTPLSTLDDVSDEELLYYATPYYDELQSRKEAHKQALKEQENK